MTAHRWPDEVRALVLELLGDGLAPAAVRRRIGRRCRALADASSSSP